MRIKEDPDGPLVSNAANLLASPAYTEPENAVSGLADFPFNDGNADVVFKSRDLVQFRVHSAQLARASPFWANML